MDAIGGTISGSIKLFTKTEIGVKGVSLPTESITIALIICSESSDALLVSQKYTYGDEVIVSSHTFIASASAINHVGATPVLSDIGSDHLIDPGYIRKLISLKTAAIMRRSMVNHFKVDFDKVMDIKEG